MSFKKVMFCLSELSHESLVGIHCVHEDCLCGSSRCWVPTAAGTGTWHAHGFCICAAHGLGNLEPFILFALIFHIQEMYPLYPSLEFCDIV